MIGRPIIVKPPGSGGAQSISFSPDSKRIAVPGAPGTVGIWEVATGRRVGKPLAIGSVDVEEAIFAEGGRTLIASDDSGSVSFVDIETGRAIRPPLSVGDDVADALDSQPGWTTGGRGFVRGVGLRVGHEDRRRRTARRSGPTRVPVNDVVFSPDGRTLVTSHLQFGGRLEHERRAGDRTSRWAERPI